MRDEFLAERMWLLLVLVGTPILLVAAAILEEWISATVGNWRSRRMYHRPL